MSGFGEVLGLLIVDLNYGTVLGDCVGVVVIGAWRPWWWTRVPPWWAVLMRVREAAM